MFPNDFWVGLLYLVRLYLIENRWGHIFHDFVSSHPNPAGGSYKQNRISSVFERLLGRPLGRIANGVRKHYLSYPF